MVVPALYCFSKDFSQPSLFRKNCLVMGVVSSLPLEPEIFSLDGGVYHRSSLAYNPQPNGRAELAVKCTKRLLGDNISQDGNLDTDAFVRALLIKRNTPDPICKLSPAEIVFGRKLRDTLPRIDKTSTIFLIIKSILFGEMHGRRRSHLYEPVTKEVFQDWVSIVKHYQISLSETELLFRTNHVASLLNGTVLESCLKSMITISTL